MFGSGRDVLYETWCRNADLIFQNASTTALPPRVVRDTDARRWFGRRHPVPTAGGPLGVWGRRLEEGTLSRAALRKGQENERENTNLLVQRGIQIVIIVPQVLSHFVQQSARVHARQGSKAHRYRAERAPHRPCGARERDGSGIREHCAGQQKEKGKGTRK